MPIRATCPVAGLATMAASSGASPAYAAKPTASKTPARISPTEAGWWARIASRPNIRVAMTTTRICSACSTPDCLAGRCGRCLAVGHPSTGSG